VVGDHKILEILFGMDAGIEAPQQKHKETSQVGHFADLDLELP